MIVRVSVVIPTYNRAHVLRRAIDSVLAQTYQNFELIVVDDGSNDDTGTLVESYQHPRIRYVRHVQNKGQNAALNTGVQLSCGTYCAFLDSDDEWHADFLQKVMDRFALDDSLGCVYSWSDFCSVATGKIEVCKCFSLEGNIYHEALAQGYVSHMITLVTKRNLLFQAGLFDESFEVCQDDDICLRLAREAQFGLIREPLATIYQDAGNQTTQDRGKYAEGTWKLVTKFADETVNHCGAAVLSRQFGRCGDLFWKADDREMALLAYGRAQRLQRRLFIALKQWSLRLGLGFKLSMRLKAIGSALTRGK